MRTERWKLVLREFDADPRARSNAFFDMVRDPGEKTNLYDHKKYRKQLMQQLQIMLRTAENNEDELSIKLASRELRILQEPGTLSSELY